MRSSNPFIMKMVLLLLFSSLLTSELYAQDKWHKVATNDCGSVSDERFLIKGEPYTFPNDLGSSDKIRSCSFGSKVIYAFDKMDIHANYQLEAKFLSDAPRTIRIIADGNEITTVKLERGKEELLRMELPRKAYAYSQLVLLFEATQGPNAVVSELNLYSSNNKQLVPFVGDAKKALVNTQSYSVNKNVCAEAVLPQYTPMPSFVAGVYNPIQSLNGTWKLNDKPISVPGQWLMQGFTIDSAAFAQYTKKFDIPADWLGKRIKLRFDGVFSECNVSLNGRALGSHMGGLTAFEYDVTSYINGDNNNLCVDVRSESMADMLGSMTQYAAHQLGGITRKITLFAVPNVYVSDVRIVTDLDSLYNDAELKVRLSVTNTELTNYNDIAVRVTIDGLPIVLDKQLALLKGGETWTGELTGIVRSPKKWDNEHPNLYNMKVEIGHKEQTYGRIEKRFGFREVELKGNQLLVNGKVVKLRGVCRHESHPLTGRVLTEELQRRDVELYREANCNFIRTSHYPPAEELLAICDELGMFVEVEAPVCWIGHHANENWQTLNYQDSMYYPYVLQSNMETIHFYRNYPSVLFWSMANESYWNKEFAQILEYMKKADPSRPTTFHDQAYGGFNNQGSSACIANIHYPGPSGYKNPSVANSDRPVVYGEYCHLNVYNRSELVTDPGVRSDWALALAPTWENMYKTPAVLGGSIWSGIDDIFQLPNGDAVGYGPWGPIDGWRRPKPEYWDMKKIYSPIRVLTEALEPSSQLNIEVENRYTYTNLNELTVNWKYGKESGIARIDGKSGEKAFFSVPVLNVENANELYLSFIDPRGFVADEYLIPVGQQTQNELRPLHALSTKLRTLSDRYEISGKGFKCVISRTTGQIISAQRNGKTLLVGGPSLMVLALQGGGCYPNHNAHTPVFNDVCKDWTMTSVEAVKEGDDVVVKVNGCYDEAEGGYEIRVNATGTISVDYDFKMMQDINPRQWGMVFSSPLELSTTYWRRKGLWSVYPDNHISRPVGEAQLFYDGLPTKQEARVAPSWSWNKDFNALGSNDFRSTRKNVWYAGIKDSMGNTVCVDAKGKQHWRSWKNENVIDFLIADFSTAGFEMFLQSYYAPYRAPLKKGASVKGQIDLRLETL
ncbi:MAG: glycoside hydrolase family 2 protein [Marinifilaceae bacterium]